MKRQKIYRIAMISMIAVSVLTLVYFGYFIFVKKIFAKSNLTERSLEIVNNIRNEKGVLPLKWDEKLEKVAEEKVNDIILKKYFQHTSPDGTKAWDLILKEGYSYIYAGENLAIDYNSIDEALEAWTQSPSHYQNIISDKYEDYGFAQGEGNIEGHKAKIYVQIFATQGNSIKQLISYEDDY